jgi:peptidoglycan glycosyltransferase
MNRQITRLAFLGVALIVALIVATTYWQTWASAGLADRQDNAIQRVAQYSIRRGVIYASDGRTVLAANRPKRVGGRTLYFRRYPAGALAPHVVGYSTQSRNQTGVEREENDYLTGANANLNSLFQSTVDKLKGQTVRGNSLVLAIDARAQRIANEQLHGKCGSVVALEPSTGRVLVMASSPTYDLNLVESTAGYRQIQKIRGACSPAAPLLNRATDGLFTPGSTFKIVTAAAALDSGAFTPSSTFNDPGYCTEYGKPVYNSGNPDQNGPEQFGTIDFNSGFEHSVNSVFCNIGLKIGAKTILEYSKRFGFYSVPPLQTPINERAASGLYFHHALYLPKDPATQVDPGRLAFGQERMLVTPLQAAMVTAAVANHGVIMRPTLIDRIIGPRGGTVSKPRPQRLWAPIKPRTAAELTHMMELVVEGGTGTHAQIPGISVAGKTGTAETGVNGINTTWFDAFAPADHPRVAIAVVLQNQHGFGGTTAAPIAKVVMQAILRRGSK